jgi:glucose-6-phosphate 1-dehydrogenase
MSKSNTNATGTPPLDMIIFGGTGDLSIRKLLPALYMAHLHGNLPSSTRIVAVGRYPHDRDGYIEFVQKDAQPFIDAKNFEPQAWQSFLDLLYYVCLDATDRDSYAELGRVSRPRVERVFYLATAPTLFTAICDNLAANGLVDDASRVVLEKPLGHDLASAREINLAVGKHFRESQIYRIDHYLGKETVQNLMVLRFGNGLLEPLWRAPNIVVVQITVAETVGVGSRAGFYDGTGALRDLVQNHLLQLL